MTEKKTELSFAELRRANLERAGATQRYRSCLEWSPEVWFAAMMGEIGEAMGERKNALLNGGKPTYVQRIGLEHEIADVMIYLDLWANSLGIDLGKVVALKFNAVSKRVGSKVTLPVP